MHSSPLILFALVVSTSTAFAFIPPPLPFRAPTLSTISSSSLHLFGFSDEDERVISQIESSKGLSREEAEKDFKLFKANPNEYALMKGEVYYQSLGYDKLMDGVIGEAEKQGRGEEVRERIAKFKRDSRNKALAVIGSGVSIFMGLKLYSDYDPAGFEKLMGGG